MHVCILLLLSSESERACIAKYACTYKEFDLESYVSSSQRQQRHTDNTK